MNSELARARKSLRAALRARRRAVPPLERIRAAERVARHIQREFYLHPGQRIAVYAAMAEELDTAPLIRIAQRHGCAIYLPRIVDFRRRRMVFVGARGPMRRNALGISEPDMRNVISARWLDLTFVPLVGFDATGMRLGMGAGYYDRAFAYLTTRTAWRRPRLIGLAYSFQQVETIESAPHDVGLDAVVTEQGVLWCHSGF